MIRFTVMGTPIGKARARTVVQGGRVHSYTPSKTVNYEKAVAWACKKACQGFKFKPGTPLRLEAWIYMPIPKSTPKHVFERLLGTWHTKKPDLSNVLKSLEDSMVGILYDDDSQIAAEYIQKKYSDCPRVEVRIEVIE